MITSSSLLHSAQAFFVEPLISEVNINSKGQSRYLKWWVLSTIQLTGILSLLWTPIISLSNLTPVILLLLFWHICSLYLQAYEYELFEGKNSFAIPGPIYASPWLLGLPVLSLFYPVLLQVQNSDACVISLRAPFTTGILWVSERFAHCFGRLIGSGHSAENIHAAHLLLYLAGLYSVLVGVPTKSSRFFSL